MVDREKKRTDSTGKSETPSDDLARVSARTCAQLGELSANTEITGGLHDSILSSGD